MNHENLIAQMTLKEKIGLCSGRDFWSTKQLTRLDIPSFTMSDGPHGIRKQTAGQVSLGFMASEDATCFPPACLTGCSFDPELVRELAEALGMEASAKNVQMVLGPGVNIKREPLCGRNFEYFSEDPYLAGEMGKAWIEGIHKTGVGACLKHFMCNNQEDLRMTSDSMVDLRAMHEIYLPAFKKALQAYPDAVMCAYNKTNGVYMSDNRELVRGLLREKWEYNGMVMTDWGGMNDRVEAFRAAVDLEMPGSGGYFDRDIKRAVKKGLLSEDDIDECVDRILDAAFRLNREKKQLSYDPKEHHMLAKKIAARSAVLLKNDGILPLLKSYHVSVVGGLARHARFQGSGSSHINTHMTSTLLDGLNEHKIAYTYFDGYHMNNSTSEELLEKAIEGCRGSDVVLIAAGLTDRSEAEGFDRRDMQMPEAQNRVIERVAGCNPNAVVVLFGGAPMEMPWLDRVRGLLHMYLPGQAGGLAAADLLFGAQNPSGKLAESYPLRYEDAPASNFYGKTERQVQYRESVFVGYRYYDKLEKPVLFPFGFGLSYTRFEYKELSLSKKEMDPGEGLECVFLLRNTGGVSGAEVAQVYVSKPVTGPVRELAGFAKVFLNMGEEKEVRIQLDAQAFLTYNSIHGKFVLYGGEYGISVGSSSRDILLTGSVAVHGMPEAGPLCDLDSYIKGELSQREFALMLGRPIHRALHQQKGGYTRTNTLAEMSDSWISRLIVWVARWALRRSNKLHEEHPLFIMMMDILMNMPVGRFPLMTASRVPRWAIRILLNIENGRFWFAREKKKISLV